jgi:hypothetical protein
VSNILVLLVLLLGLALALFLHSKRDRSQAKLWGDQPAQHSVMGGAELEMPRIFPVEPVAGPLINGALVDDLSHNFTIDKTDANVSNP